MGRKLIKRVSVFLVAAAMIPSLAFGQVPEETSSVGPRKQLATIIFCGLGGAVLGLSTLSFYGRPQDRLSNIAVGFAVGIIGGTVYSTYKTATRPYDQYQGVPGTLLEPEYYSPRDEEASVASLTIPLGGYRWEF